MLVGSHARRQPGLTCPPRHNPQLNIAAKDGDVIRLGDTSLALYLTPVTRWARRHQYSTFGLTRSGNGSVRASASLDGAQSLPARTRCALLGRQFDGVGSDDSVFACGPKPSGQTIQKA